RATSSAASSGSGSRERRRKSAFLPSGATKKPSRTKRGKVLRGSSSPRESSSPSPAFHRPVQRPRRTRRRQEGPRRRPPRPSYIVDVMKFTRKTDYALRAMQNLARRYYEAAGEGVAAKAVPVPVLARESGLSLRFLSG